MATYQTLQDRVTRRVIDLPASVLAEVPTLVNEAIRALQDLHNFKVMEAETGQTETTSGSHTLLTVPSDFKELRGTPYEVLNDGTTRDLLLASSREAALDVYPLADPNDVGEPKTILDAEPSDVLGGRDFEVYPFPDAASDWPNGNYRIVIPYWKYLPDLADGTDANWFTNSGVEYIIHKATAEAFYLDWDEGRASVWETKAAGQFARVLTIDKRYRVGGLRTLRISMDVHGPKMGF